MASDDLCIPATDRLRLWESARMCGKGTIHDTPDWSHHRV
jgi:hypothetical protein